MAFHDGIITFSGNNRMINMIRSHVVTNLFVMTKKKSLYVGVGEVALAGHQRIIKAIESRNADLAEQTMRHEIRAGAEYLKKHFEG